MKKILFVCHGNICRSPMAEYLMKELVNQAGLSHAYQIASAGTSREELGNPVYPPAKRILLAHGISCNGHKARQLQKQDYDAYDLFIGMDRANIREMHRMFDGDPAGKIKQLLDMTAHPGDVADPWYTGDFQATWLDVERGCQALLTILSSDRTESQD